MWLCSHVCALVFVAVFLGAALRLSRSCLSVVFWAPRGSSWQPLRFQASLGFVAPFSLFALLFSVSRLFLSVRPLASSSLGLGCCFLSCASAMFLPRSARVPGLCGWFFGAQLSCAFFALLEFQSSVFWDSCGLKSTCSNEGVSCGSLTLDFLFDLRDF